MPSTRIKGVIGLVIAVAIVQIFYEDVLVFLGIAGTGGDPPLWIYIAIPSVLMGLLILVLIGGAILTDDTLR